MKRVFSYICLILASITLVTQKVYASDKTGELLRDTCDGNGIYWVQSGKKYHVPSMDIINHMKAHGIPNWDSWRDVCGISASLGPPFYYKDSRSDGLLIKIYQQTSIYLIDNAKKRLLVNEYSFENYKYKGTFLSWGDIISVTSDICNNEFPTGSEIKLVPTLSSPSKGASFTNPTVTLYWNAHPNPAWKYHLQVDNDSNFSSPIYDNSNLSTTNQSVTVPSSGRYYWRVRGTKSGSAPSDWSEVWYFDVELTGFASVSSGVTVTPSTIYAGDTFNVTFTLKEIQGAPITFTKIVCAILDESGKHLFDLQDYSSITVPARGTWKYTGSGYLDDAGTYQAVARGKVTDWFDFKTVDAGVNPGVFHVLSKTGIIKVTTNRSDATFSITGPKDYEGSGTSWTTTDAPPGPYSIEFHDIHTPDGYGYGVYPQPSSQTLTAGDTITFHGDYQQQYEPPIPLIENGPALSGHINEGYYQKYKFAVVADGRKYTMTLTPSSGNPDLYYANHDEGINPFDPGTCSM